MGVHHELAVVLSLVTMTDIVVAEVKVRFTTDQCRVLRQTGVDVDRLGICPPQQPPRPPQQTVQRPEERR